MTPAPAWPTVFLAAGRFDDRKVRRRRLPPDVGGLVGVLPGGDSGDDSLDFIYLHNESERAREREDHVGVSGGPASAVPPSWGADFRPYWARGVAIWARTLSDHYEPQSFLLTHGDHLFIYRAFLSMTPPTFVDTIHKSLCAEF